MSRGGPPRAEPQTPTQSLAGLLWAPCFSSLSCGFPAPPIGWGHTLWVGQGAGQTPRWPPGGQGSVGGSRRGHAGLACVCDPAWSCGGDGPRVGRPAPSLCGKSGTPRLAHPILVAAEVELAVGWSGGARGDLTSLRPIFADTEWWWRVSAETGPTSTAWSSCCRRR